MEITSIAQKMALNLCSSPSSLHKPLNKSTNFKLKILQIQSKSSLQINSLQNPSTKSEIKHPDFQKFFSSKSYKPVTLQRPTSRLAKVSESLNACKNEAEVAQILDRRFNDKYVDKHAVFLINNMTSPDAALLTLRYFVERFEIEKEVILYCATMKVFRKCKDFFGAEKLFDEMVQRGVKPDNYVFSSIISCARLCNLHYEGVLWFEKMPGFGISPDRVTCVSVIECYALVGNVEMALNLYDRGVAERWDIDVSTFCNLIRSCGILGMYNKCLSMYEDMKGLGVKPTWFLYNTLLDAMEKANRPLVVRKVFDEMIENGIEARYVPYAILLRSYALARYGEDALNVYREMKEKRFKMDCQLYNILLAMCADLSLLTEGIEIFEDMKSFGVKPDSWTFSAMSRIFSGRGEVSEVENMFNEMLKAGFQSNVYVWTSLIQCYGKALRTDDVVRTFNQLLDSGVKPNGHVCAGLLNVLAQVPKEEFDKLAVCLEIADSVLGSFVKLTISEESTEVNFKKEATKLLYFADADIKTSYCNCLIDFCVKLNMLERASLLLHLGVAHGIYSDLQYRSSTQWSLHLYDLTLGGAVTALHGWINDLSKAVDSGDELPPLLGIDTGHEKRRSFDESLAVEFGLLLKELNAPFHEAPDKVGWFIITKAAAESWLESRKQTEVAVV